MPIRPCPLALMSLFMTLATATACRESSTTAPSTGQLSVSMAGLPAGVKPMVTVSGPSSFRATVDSASTLMALPAGDFTIVPNDVTAGTVRYGGTPATQTVTVARDGVATATQILYGVTSTRLTVSVIGLPAGAPANVTITGPRGYSRTVSGSTQIDLLEPGTYTLTAADVAAGTSIYRAVTGTQQIGLSASLQSAVANVEYGAGLGTLRVNVTGLPFDVPALVDVTGPNGFARRITSSAVFGRLEAGTYTLAAAVVGSVLTTHTPTPARRTVVLTGSDTATAPVAYDSAPLQLSLQPFLGGLTQAVFLSAPPGDDRQFVVERGGRIKLVMNGAVQTTPFLDISSRVNNQGERGMLGMAWDPLYAANGWFYVFYVALNGNVVVERFGSTPGANVSGGAGTVVISIPHGGSEHHGGMVEFGPDGMLYLAPGDGACCGDPKNNAQNLGTLLGKVLRIDVRTLPYRIPADNPFIAQGGALPEIWAFGLRSPWRFSFDRPTGTLYIGDVGQDAREEVNAVAAQTSGINYGWPYTEGTACYNPAVNCTVGRTLTLPVLDYSHADGCSVIGGYVYRGSAIPELAGHYLYADFCRGWVRSFQLNNGRATELRSWNGISLPFSNSFGRDGAGELYLISSSRISRIVRTVR